jgi:phosphoribosylformylglycinamidine cyclo-ligase
MLRTFNMGVGLILIAGPEQAEQLLAELSARGGRDARVIGEVVAGEPSVTYS